MTTVVNIPGMRNIQIGDGQIHAVQSRIHRHHHRSPFQQHKYRKESPVEVYGKHRKEFPVEARGKHRKECPVEAHGKHRKESPVDAHGFRKVSGIVSGIVSDYLLEILSV